MQIKYLLDENILHRGIIPAVHHYSPEIDILQSGDPSAPPRGMLDPDILVWCEAHERLLVTNNRESMPDHLVDHYRQERLTWGIFVLKSSLYVRNVLDIHTLAYELYAFWETTTAAEWQNAYILLPFFSNK